jgi:hypothetical protein
VIPQLSVVAFLRDPNFIAEAKSRLQKLCPLDLTQILSMTPLERHSAAGPAGSQHRSGKMAASLIELLKLQPAATGFLEGLSQSQDLIQLVQKDLDYDNSGELAIGWLNDLKPLLP